MREEDIVFSESWQFVRPPSSGLLRSLVLAASYLFFILPEKSLGSSLMMAHVLDHIIQNSPQRMKQNDLEWFSMFSISVMFISYFPLAGLKLI